VAEGPGARAGRHPASRLAGPPRRPAAHRAHPAYRVRRGAGMRITVTWLRLDSRRRWRSLLVLALLVALATSTVLAAAAGARRGQSAGERLWTGTPPATRALPPHPPRVEWGQVPGPAQGPPGRRVPG